MHIYLVVANICRIFTESIRHNNKTNDMKNLTKLTGKTEQELKDLYLAAIDTLINFGATEAQAREMVKETFTEALGL